MPKNREACEGPVASSSRSVRPPAARNSGARGRVSPDAMSRHRRRLSQRCTDGRADVSLDEQQHLHRPRWPFPADCPTQSASRRTARWRAGPTVSLEHKHQVAASGTRNELRIVLKSLPTLTACASSMRAIEAPVLPSDSASCSPTPGTRRRRHRMEDHPGVAFAAVPLTRRSLVGPRARGRR